MSSNKRRRNRKDLSCECYQVCTCVTMTFCKIIFIFVVVTAKSWRRHAASQSCVKRRLISRYYIWNVQYTVVYTLYIYSSINCIHCTQLSLTSQNHLLLKKNKLLFFFFFFSTLQIRQITYSVVTANLCIILLVFLHPL